MFCIVHLPLQDSLKHNTRNHNHPPGSYVSNVAALILQEEFAGIPLDARIVIGTLWNNTGHSTAWALSL